MSRSYDIERTEQGLDIYEASARIAELETLLADARDRLAEFIGTDCECDNTHEANNTKCMLCMYAEALGLGEAK